MAVLPYVGTVSLKLKSYLSGQGFDCAFQRGTTLGSMLYRKYDLTKPEPKNVVYKVPCSNCDQFYIGKTRRALSTRISEHQSAIQKSDHNPIIVLNLDIP